MLQIIDTGISSAKKNMDLDEKYLARLSEEKAPLLHLYEWERDSLSYGYFIDLSMFIRTSLLEKLRIDATKRPTGGGIVFHIWDYAFSFLMPASHPCFSINALENYRFVNQIVLTALQEFIQKTHLCLIGQDVAVDNMEQESFCMAHPTKYDVLLDGKKVAGAAQRKTKNGYLHQGTISLGLPKKELLHTLLFKNSISSSMFKYSYAPLGELWTPQDMSEARHLMKSLLMKNFTDSLKK